MCELEAALFLLVEDVGADHELLCCRLDGSELVVADARSL